MMQILNIIFSLIVICFMFYTFAQIFVAVRVLIKVRQGILDELERKMVFDSLSYSMLIIMLLHIIQLGIGMFYNSTANAQHYFIPVISAGMPFKTFLANDPWHIEAIAFDCLVFSICYSITKRKYKD